MPRFPSRPRPVSPLPGLALPLLLLVALPPAAAPAAAEAPAPRVVVSIKPLHSLVAGVMAGIGEPLLLLEGAASPHSASLRPSQARALDRAEAVFWIGPTLEGFLAKPLTALAADAAVVALGKAEEVTRLPARAGGAWEAEAEAGEDHEHGDQHLDPHVWLDPRNARAMVRAVAETLGRLDPARAGRYAANADSLSAGLEALEAELDALLAPVRDRPYVVFHDAYRYFEARFGLSAVGSVTVSPERPPGARRLAELRDRIERLGARCILAEPQFEPALVRTLAEASGARVGLLDPLGTELPAGPAAYAALLRDLAASLRDCLAPTG